MLSITTMLYGCGGADESRPDLGVQMPDTGGYDVDAAEDVTDAFDMLDGVDEDLGAADVSAPVVIITSGAVADLAGNYSLEGTVSDDVGVVSLTYQVGDGVPQDVPLPADIFRLPVELPTNPSVVRVVASDAAGNEGVASLEVGWAPSDAIVPSFSSPSTLWVHRNLVFDAASTDNPRDKAIRYSWDFGDGTLREGSELVRAGHRYDEPGDYVVSLTVTAADGESATTDRAVIVSTPQGNGTATVFGEVFDDDGGALHGVDVFDDRGALIATTDFAGRYEATILRDVPVALRLERSDYTEQVVRLRVPVSESSASAHSTMKLRSPPVYLIDAAQGGEVYGEDGARLEFPAGALVDEETGAPVVGTVAVLMTPVDMVSPIESLAFPGGFTGFTPEGEEPEIASHGVVEVELLQDGRPLQIASGKTVTIDIPSPAASPGAVIPIWSLDPRSGYWDHGGEGTVVSNRDGVVLRAEVPHFSWWNSDVVLGSGYVTGRLNFTLAGQSWPGVGRPRVSVIAPQTPRRNINTPIDVALGGMPSLDFPIPSGLEVEVEAIDVVDGKLYYGLGGVTFDQNNLDHFFNLKEVVVGGGGANSVPLLDLPLQGARSTHTLTAADSSYFFRVNLRPGESLNVDVTPQGATGRVIIRDAEGRRVAARPFHSFSEPLLYPSVTGGAFYVHVRPEDNDFGDFAISGAVVTDAMIRPGEALENQTLPVGETRAFVVQENRGKHISAQVFGGVDGDGNELPIALQSWVIRAEGPTGQSIGEISRGNASRYAQFTPKSVPRSNGFRLRVSSFDVTSADRTFSIMYGDVKEFPGEFVESMRREYAGTLSEDGETHRFDFIGKPDHHVHVYLKNVSTNAKTPLLLGGSGALSRPVFFDETTQSAHIKTQLSSFNRTGTIWLTYPGTLPSEETTDATGQVVKTTIPRDYVLVVEQSPATPSAVVGDCASATMGSLILAQAAVSEGGTIELCDGEHLLIEPLKNLSLLRGLSKVREHARVRFVDDSSVGGGLFAIDSRLQLPVTVESLTFEQKSSGAMNLNTEMGVVLRDLTLTLSPESSVDSASAISVGNGIGQAGPLTIDGLELSNWNTGIRVTGARDVEVEDVTFDSVKEFAGSIVQIQTGGGDVAIRNVISRSVGPADIKFGAPLTMATSGSVEVEGCDIRHAGSGAAIGVYASGAAWETAVTLRGNTVLMTNPTTTASASIYEPIHVSLRGTQQDVLIEHNLLGTTNMTSATRGLTVKTNGSTTALKAVIRGNVIWNFRNASIFPNIDRFSQFDIVQNSVLVHEGAVTGAFDLASVGAGNVVLQNNAIAFDTSTTHPAVRVSGNISVSGANNLFYNTDTAFSDVSNIMTTGDIQSEDPEWDTAWDMISPVPLLPYPTSPLIDGGEGHVSTPSRDIVGAMCPAGVSVDIGAYEQ